MGWSMYHIKSFAQMACTHADPNTGARLKHAALHLQFAEKGKRPWRDEQLEPMKMNLT